MAQIPEATQKHYRRVQALQLVAIKAGRRAWTRVDWRYITSSWLPVIERELVPALEGVQFQAALAGSVYAASTLAEQGTYVAQREFTDPRAFVGYASDGRDLTGLLYTPAVRAKHLIAGGMDPRQALAGARGTLDTITRTLTADTARQAAGVDIVTRPAVGYVRMLNPPSCSRCTILAGRVYRWNAGFLRHPRCDCVHVATTTSSLDAARDEGLVDDPYAYFESLSEAEQDKHFTKAGAQAIRDGADVSQVVNAHRGMTANGNFTTEGTGRRGAAGQLLRPGRRRMTPELIYEQAAGDRGRALELLREHGYILPQGQVPGGALRGQELGFGALGRGGTRRAASTAVLDAHASGVRDPNVRYTMTAAERRLHDAQQRYETALSGVDPYSSPGFGNTPNPRGERLNRVGAATRPATPEVVARAEADYRRWLATGGQIHTS